MSSLPMKYFRIWCRLAIMSFKIQTGHALSSTGYLLGKMVRLVFFLVFLFAIFRHTKALAGYTLEETALFFLTFNLVDTLAQLFFRGIYGIRGLIKEGDYDYFLMHPVHILFRVAFNTVDFLDVVAVLPVMALTGFILTRMPGGLNLLSLGLYVFLTINGILIALAIHIMVGALAVLTQEMENTIWIYRDLMTLGRFPSDIYASPMRQILLFVVPIAVMTSFPVKGYLGQLGWTGVIYALIVTGCGLTLAFAFWNFANKRYTSASS